MKTLTEDSRAPRRPVGVLSSALRLPAAFACALVLVVLPALAARAATTLEHVSYSTLPGSRVRIALDMSAPVKEPLSFSIDHPARVVLDFPGVGLGLAHKTTPVDFGLVRSVTAVEASGRTRVVLDLVKLVPYHVTIKGHSVYVTTGAPLLAKASAPLGGQAVTRSAAPAAPPGTGAIRKIDFRRSVTGAGRVLVTLSNPAIVVNTHRAGDSVDVDFRDTTVPPKLRERLLVTDFATPVTMIETRQVGHDVHMRITGHGQFEQIVYQADNLLTVEVRPITAAQKEKLAKKKFGFTGKRLSLNFQNIEVRAVLQLLADFTGLNLVASDTVKGNITLRLKNVPWDQALHIILQAKGLAMRRIGNVILVAPSAELAAREKLQLEARQQVANLAPLTTQLIQVNYAKASDIAKLLKAGKNSLLTKRGSVSVDARTNTLLIRDTAAAIANIRRLIVKLDVPVRQVLIESRIVEADNTFTRQLGVKFGASFRNNQSGTVQLGGQLPGDTNYGGNATFNTSGNENYMVSLPIAGPGAPAASLGVALLSIPDTILQLELQALQTEGRGEVLSNPRVVTSDQKQATIEQGTEIPYQQSSSSGATSTAFKKAVLSLKVTPQITPDNRIIMDLAVNQDTVGQIFSGIPSINTKSLDTQVLVNDGETVVLGGIFEQTKRLDSTKVPFLGDLPYLGALFRSTNRQNNKTELLIFVTPKILKNSLSLQ